MSKTFELPLDSIKPCYLFNIFHHTKWNSEVDFNLKNPGFTFKIEIKDKDIYLENNIKKILNKALKKLENNNNNNNQLKNILEKNNNSNQLKNILKKAIQKISNKNKTNDIISNLKNMNSKIDHIISNQTVSDTVINMSESNYDTWYSGKCPLDNKNNTLNETDDNLNETDDTLNDNVDLEDLINNLD